MNNIGVRIVEWTKEHGKPSIVVTCRCNNFLLRELKLDMLHVCLPDIVWPHNTLYLENVMSRERIDLDVEAALDRNYSINGYGDR